MLRQGFAGQAGGEGQSIPGPLQLVKGAVPEDKLEKYRSPAPDRKASELTSGVN